MNWAAGVRALELVRPIAGEYGLETGDLKPCIAYLLDGNLGVYKPARAAWVIAIELRRMGRAPRDTEVILQKWAWLTGITISQGDLAGAVRNAFKKTPRGDWHYRAPGLRKTSPAYAPLQPLCDSLGCPNQCPPLCSRSPGNCGETFKRFGDLGWPNYLKRKRHSAAVLIYRELCDREGELGLAPGHEIHIADVQLAELTGSSRQHIGTHLRWLHELGLLATLRRGSRRRGEQARATTVARAVPIPRAPLDASPPITTRARDGPQHRARVVPIRKAS